MNTNNYSKKAIVGLCLAILSLFIDYSYGVYVGFVSVMLCTLSLKEIKDKNLKGKLFAIMGILIATVPIVLLLLLTSLVAPV